MNRRDALTTLACVLPVAATAKASAFNPWDPKIDYRTKESQTAFPYLAYIDSAVQGLSSVEPAPQKAGAGSETFELVSMSPMGGRRRLYVERSAEMITVIFSMGTLILEKSPPPKFNDSCLTSRHVGRSTAIAEMIAAIFNWEPKSLNEGKNAAQDAPLLFLRKVRGGKAGGGILLGPYEWTTQIPNLAELFTLQRKLVAACRAELEF